MTVVAFAAPLSLPRPSSYPRTTCTAPSPFPISADSRRPNSGGVRRNPSSNPRNRRNQAPSSHPRRASEDDSEQDNAHVPNPSHNDDDTDPQRRQPSSSSNQDAASSAFDAVDRLFGSSPPPNRQNFFPPRAGNREHQNQPEAAADKNGTLINRRKWLEDVKARAATSRPQRNAAVKQRDVNRPPDQDMKNDANVFDVEAIEDTTEYDGKEEREDLNSDEQSIHNPSMDFESIDTEHDDSTEGIEIFLDNDGSDSDTNSSGSSSSVSSRSRSNFKSQIYNSKNSNTIHGGNGNHQNRSTRTNQKYQGHKQGREPPQEDRSVRNNHHPRDLNENEESSARRPRTRDSKQNDNEESDEYLTKFKTKTFDLLMQVINKGPSLAESSPNGRNRGFNPSRSTRSSNGNSTGNKNHRTNITNIANNIYNKHNNNITTNTDNRPSNANLAASIPKLTDMEQTRTPDKRAPSNDSPNADVKNLEVSQRLNEIISGRSGLDTNLTMDEFDVAEKDMDAVIDIQKQGTRLQRRRKFSLIRRNGQKLGRRKDKNGDSPSGVPNLDNVHVEDVQNARSVLEPPKMWDPLSNHDVGLLELKSDQRALKGSKYLNNLSEGAVSDCANCEGTGLEECAACLGEGWIPPLESLNAMASGSGEQSETNRKRLKMLDDMWMRPNLVINSLGEAQCTRCNGLGKQLCMACDGSGSNLKKGFDASEYYKVFDMFGGSKDGPPEVTDQELRESMGGFIVNEDEDDDEDEDENEVSKDLDSFKLYTGSATADIEGLFAKDGQEARPIPTVAVKDDIDLAAVEDESAQLLATLEAMHNADIEAHDLSLDERLGIRKTPLAVDGNVVTAVDEDVLDDDDDLDMDLDVDGELQEVEDDDEDVEEDVDEVEDVDALEADVFEIGDENELDDVGFEEVEIEDLDDGDVEHDDDDDVPT